MSEQLGTRAPLSSLVTTPPEAAKRLDISVGRVHRMIASGQLPATKLGGQWMIANVTIDRLIEEILAPTPKAARVASAAE